MAGVYAGAILQASSDEISKEEAPTIAAAKTPSS
jgi:hypothetical protein